MSRTLRGPGDNLDLVYSNPELTAMQVAQLCQEKGLKRIDGVLWPPNNSFTAKVSELPRSNRRLKSLVKSHLSPYFPVACVIIDRGNNVVRVDADKRSSRAPKSLRLRRR